MAVCGAKAGHTTGSAQGATSEETLKDFITKTLEGDGDGNWPTSRTAKGKEPKATTNDNAEAVAKDLVKELNHEEKTIVAGLLAKTIEGGEVVEIRAVSSTFIRI
ncbi:hypothetical protein ANAPC3_01032 [Anaplasma phagocytophilum]|nr:hypothetical protein ANAPC2_00997 [Anaplasma phagocytophilum]SBO32874.1 hypothetical protein ANAPC4_00960 [Anaplasma phagocytophilum]SBO32909.1 hypothetical protein ANAPC3_01032 [Anaplasma phagocytophilum]